MSGSWRDSLTIELSHEMTCTSYALGVFFDSDRLLLGVLFYRANFGEVTGAFSDRMA